MKRSTFDILMATAGLFLAVTLIAAGGMLTWAHTFIGNEVHTQLAAQQIFFPAANSKAVAAVMLILGGLGLVHARRVSPAAEILGGHPANGRPRSPYQGRPTRPELIRVPQTVGDSRAKGCHTARSES